MNTWLAGGRPPDRAGNGVLTGAEAAHLRLAGTRLAVLSACDSGLGHDAGAEGVFGLRRAFRIAGAMSVVMTLWRIPDRTTATFMAGFYSELASGADVATALAMAQRRLAEDGPDASTWAAFICQGAVTGIDAPTGGEGRS
ncbi:CHAT domain-containing protein [Actinomadura sp. HBU206391]|uniref:CHAT domain-containing protein n=1 Tax=Actinomadura sp. HBU206391 TaxID=2731692 RepID=UPI001C9C9465|nr:CHAT domain-containing protein [Actinomadura sp. HBU206391]